jgi:NmrA-like family
MVDALLKTGKFKITAITRTDSTSQIPAGVEVKHIDYDNQATIVEALQGQEVLIITMGTRAPSDQQTKLIEAAAAAKVPFVLPNEFGGDNANVASREDVVINAAKTQYRELIEKLGVSSWIGICTGFWYEFSLGLGNYGIDIKNRSATFYDDGNTRITTSSFPQVGRGVAQLLSLKVSPDNEQDTTPCLSNYKNKFVYIGSFVVNQREMLDSILRVTNTTEQDWKIERRLVQDVYDEGLQKFQKGDYYGLVAVLYARSFFKDNSGNTALTRGLDNDKLGLPKEDLDEFTKIAVERSEKGITY